MLARDFAWTREVEIHMISNHKIQAALDEIKEISKIDLDVMEKTYKM